jgi:hypothetical protein
MFKSQKLNKILAAVTADQKYRCCYPDPFLSDLNLDDFYAKFDYHTFGQRVTTAGLITWLCTDTQVGLYAYYFGNELVAISYQSARKSDLNLFWVSTELREKMREFVLSLYTSEQDLDGFWLIDDEISDAGIDNCLENKRDNDEYHEQKYKKSA